MKLGPRIIGITGGLTLLLSGPASGQIVIDFDTGLPGACSATAIPSTYAGFDWSGGWGSCKKGVIPNSGVQDGISSGEFGIFNTSGQAVHVSRSTPFNFLSAFFNPAWWDGLEVTISGFLGGNSVFTTVLTLSASTAGTTELFGFWVDRVEISTSQANGSPAFGNGTELIMDDFTYSNVPEPMSFALTGTGLLGLAFFHRRRKRRLEERRLEE